MTDDREQELLAEIEQLRAEVTILEIELAKARLPDASKSPIRALVAVHRAILRAVKR